MRPALASMCDASARHPPQVRVPAPADFTTAAGTTLQDTFAQWGHDLRSVRIGVLRSVVARLRSLMLLGVYVPGSSRSPNAVARFVCDRAQVTVRDALAETRDTTRRLYPLIAADSARCMEPILSSGG